MTEIYIYPCSVCKEEFKWSVPESSLGKTCPDCRSTMMDEMIAWGEEQGKEEEILVERISDWWDGLPKDVQEKAFFYVVKRIVDAELKEEKSYRQIIHEDFGFDQRAYYMGIICGFMELHNSIVLPDELSEMRKALKVKKEEEKRLREKFRIKTQCDRCGFQSMDIYPEQNLMCPTSWCEGGMVDIGKKGK